MNMMLNSSVKWFVRKLMANPKCAGYASQLLNASEPAKTQRWAAAKFSYPMCDSLILCAFSLWNQRRKGARYDIVAVTDDPDRYGRREVERTLAPWKEWAVLSGYYDLTESKSLQEWQSGGPATGRNIFCLSVDPQVRLRLEKACRERESQLFTPDTPPLETMAHDLLREVNHFHFEYGAHNEWADVDTNYSPDVLHVLSSVSCRMVYPSWAVEGMDRKSRPSRVIDIGCGPISLLRWGALRGDLEITGIDPLLEMYALMKARHGYDQLPSIRCDHEIPEFAEELNDLVPDGQYDVIFSQNALDHTQIPEKVVASFESKLAPGGRIAIAVATREGTRQNWDQFHKTDLDVRDGEVVFRRQNTDWMPLFPSDSKLRLSKVCSYSPSWMSVIIERK